MGNQRKDRKPEYHYQKAATTTAAAASGPAVTGQGYDGGGDRGHSCCSLAQLKFSLYLFNVLFFVSGIILISIGLWTFLEKHPSLIFLTAGLYDVSACILIFAGIVILIVAISGFCGLSRDNHAIILCYSVLLFLIFLGEIGAGSLAYLFKDPVVDHLNRNLQVIFLQKYGVDNTSTTAVDHLQIGLDCCGVDSFQDWSKSAWSTTPTAASLKVPYSCCKTPQVGCGTRDHPSNIKYTGCGDRVARIAEDHLMVVGAIALGICILQLIGTILACALHCRLRKVFR